MKHVLLGDYAWWLPRVIFLSLGLLLAVSTLRNTMDSPFDDDGYREDTNHKRYLNTFFREGILKADGTSVVVDEEVFLKWFEANSDLGRDVAAVREGSSKDEKKVRELSERKIFTRDDQGKLVLDRERYQKIINRYPSGHYLEQAKQNLDRFHIKDGALAWDFFYLREPNTFPVDPMIPRGNFYDRNGKLMSRLPEGKHHRIPETKGLFHLLGMRQMMGLERHLDKGLTGKLHRGVHDLFGLKGNHVRGDDVRISVDSDLSQHIYKQFEEQGAKGSCVVLEVATGRVLSAVSAPEPNWENSYKQWLEHEDKPLLNRTWGEVFFPGSTFKTVVAATQLTHPDLVEEDLKLVSDPRRKVRDMVRYKRVRNHKGLTAKGRLNMELALAYSSNTYFARQALVLGEHLPHMARNLGFDQSVNLLANQPDALAWYTSAPHGYPRDIPFKRGNHALYAQYAIGQNAIKSHPLHMASIMQAIANDGLAHAPTLISGRREGLRIRDIGQPGEFETVPVVEGRRLLSSDVATGLRKAMSRTMNHEWGTGYRAPQIYRIEGEGRSTYISARRSEAPKGGKLIKSAGKTGTAQDGKRKPHAWFVGFAPAKNPKVAVAVVVENSGTGAAHAIPIAAEAMARALDIR